MRGKENEYKVYFACEGLFSIDLIIPALYF